MLFAAYTPPSGYAPPPRRQTNPLLIVLGVCGGCAVIAIIVVVAGGAFVFNKIGGVFSRSMAATQFVVALKKQQYSQAETLLTPQEQQALPTDQLMNKMTGLEKKYGTLQTGSPQPVIHQDQERSNDLNQLNKVTDYNVMLTFESGTHNILLHFDTTPGQTNKIASIDWNPGEESGSSGEVSGGAAGSRRNKGHRSQ